MNKLKTVPTSSNNLEPKENITDVDKLKTVSVDYKNLSNVVEMRLLKKQYHELVKTVIVLMIKFLVNLVC